MAQLRKIVYKQKRIHTRTHMQLCVANELKEEEKHSNETLAIG